MAIDRVDEAAARQAAREGCNEKVEREVPIVRADDHCMLYAVENDGVWSFRSPPMPPPPYVPAPKPSPPIAFDPAAAPLQACRDAGGSDCAITAIGPSTVAPK